jgi:hypothetical protein
LRRRIRSRLGRGQIRQRFVRGKRVLGHGEASKAGQRGPGRGQSAAGEKRNES